MTEHTKQQVEELTDHIMKKCLWQFHSRNWDRERQNNHILGMVTQLVCDEEVLPQTDEERCYWVDAVCLADAFFERFPWLAEMSLPERKAIMVDLKDRIDFLTIKGSLNEELSDEKY